MVLAIRCYAQFGASGKPTVVVFWASFAEGDFKVLSGVAETVAGHAGVDAVAVSCDVTKSGAESFLTKLGTAIPTAKITNLEVGIPIAFDPSKGFRKALQEATGKPSVGVSAVFLVNAAGAIVWFEQFGQVNKHLCALALDSNFFPNTRQRHWTPLPLPLPLPSV